MYSSHMDYSRAFEEIARLGTQYKENPSLRKESLNKLVHYLKNAKFDCSCCIRAGSRMRVMAATILGELQDINAVEPLINALKFDSTTDVRRAAALALGCINDPRGVLPLLKALEFDPFWTVHRDAATALRRMSMPYIEDLRIMAIIRSINWRSWTRKRKQWAEWALNELTGDRAKELLFIARNDPEEKTCQNASWALEKLSTR